MGGARCDVPVAAGVPLRMVRKPCRDVNHLSLQDQAAMPTGEKLPSPVAQDAASPVPLCPLQTRFRWLQSCK